MSENKKLKAALLYLEKYNLSIIPIINGDKKPHIEWAKYQKEKPTIYDVNKWWDQWPDANIGIVTGEINNISVIDVDMYKMTSEEKQEYRKLFPEINTPTVVSPRIGYHYYFQFCPELPNKPNIHKNVDGRNMGNYIIAPPSTNGAGFYKWIPGKRIDELPFNKIPNIYIDIFLSFINSLRTVTKSSSGFSSNPNIKYFIPGRRDEDLFTVANSLLKSRLDENFVRQALELIANNLGSEFNEKVINEKINSAMKRVDMSDKALAEEVREWVLSSSGDFLSSEIVKELGLSSKVVIKNLSKILSRLCDQGIIEKSGSKRGSWRRINRDYSEQTWWEDEGHELPLKFPLSVELFAKVYRGNVILLEGQKSQGKSAYALEFCRMNYHLFSEKVLYQNIEMSDSELKNRFLSYEKDNIVTMDQWKNICTFIRQTGEWWDKIQPDGLNVIDYLLEYEKTYLIADYVWKIHQRLKNGIALVIVQRDPLKPYPTGGRGVRDIPRLILSLVHHRIKIEDTKSFHMTMGQNPSGLIRKYKQVSWWNFIPNGEWEFGEDEKYDAFKKKKSS